jgi:phage shock protein PspC (stress-responsive transcriptional regulator)
LEISLTLKSKISLMILGISAWLGNKIGLTEKQVRLLFVLAALFAGSGVGLYLILWLVKVFTE